MARRRAMAAVIVANWWRAFPFFGVSYWPACRRSARAVRRGSVEARRLARFRTHAAGLSTLIVTIVLSFILTINDFNMCT